MPEMTEPTLTIIFAWNPGARMLQATLPNGAQFWVDTLHVNGKLGENLDLFRRAAQPKSCDYNITVVTPGRAAGTDASYDHHQREAAKREERRRQQDFLKGLQVECEL